MIIATHRRKIKLPPCFLFFHYAVCIRIHCEGDEHYDCRFKNYAACYSLNNKRQPCDAEMDAGEFQHKLFIALEKCLQKKWCNEQKCWPAVADESLHARASHNAEHKVGYAVDKREKHPER